MLETQNLYNEIRINSKYAHLYSAEYDTKDLGVDSTPIINKKALLTNDYLKRIISDIGLSNTILPPNCRYVETVDKGKIFVIEEPPARRTIRIRMDFSNEYRKLKESGKLNEYEFDKSWGKNGSYSKSFNLAFPYVIFILYINQSNQLVAGQVFLRVARMLGLSDYLLKIPLTNIADNQYVCFGDNGPPHPTLNGCVEASINNFWAAEFNTDYLYNYRAYRNTAGVSTYMEWSALTQINPLFIYNVKWVDLGMNIGEAIDEMKRNYQLIKPSDLRYQSLAQMFSHPLDTGKDIKPTKRSRKKCRLFYDVAEGTFISPEFYIHVGDPFMIKNGKVKCHINSLMGFNESGGMITHIRIEREDGRLIVLKLKKSVKKYIEDKIKQLRYEETGTLKNGVVIKENDIVEILTTSGSKVYKKVSFIRKTQEGMHEAQLSDSFYILENTEGKVFDVKEPVYKGVKLQKDVKYLYCQRNGCASFVAYKTKFHQIDTNSRGNLIITLKPDDDESKFQSHNLLLNNSSNDYKILEADKTKPMPSIFRIGRKIFCFRDHDKKLHDGFAFGTPYGIGYDSNYGRLYKPKSDEIKDYLLKDDKFHIESFDMDIDFAIGDKVVVADWENPINMLSVKVIQAFKFTEDAGDIHFILADKHGKLSEVQYVIGRSGIINVGRVRKITNEYGGVTSGTKIKSKIAGLPHFPKKDTNIIIGFITDTDGKDPLVLCSNCCTLWFSDLKHNFTKMSMKNKKWASTPHAEIDISKIKYQPGDILIGSGDYSNSTGWMITNVESQEAPKALDLRYYSIYPEYYTLDKYVIANTRFDCIPNPRFTAKERNESTKFTGWANFHGIFYKCKHSNIYFMNDERSVIDV